MNAVARGDPVTYAAVIRDEETIDVQSPADAMFCWESCHVNETVAAFPVFVRACAL